VGYACAGVRVGRIPFALDVWAICRTKPPAGHTIIGLKVAAAVHNICDYGDVLGAGMLLPVGQYASFTQRDALVAAIGVEHYGGVC
jgi:hypothetical protein